MDDKALLLPGKADATCLPSQSSSLPAQTIIRDFIPGEEGSLRQVFMSSVHEIASSFYTKEQLDAWAPSTCDEQQWADKIAALRPFVAEVDGCITGYADLQDSGYIDHFFVSGQFAGLGVGSALMAHIHQAAAARAIPELFAHVSLAAESFFSRHGFTVTKRQSVAVRGISMENVLMVKPLLANSSSKPATDGGGFTNRECGEEFPVKWHSEAEDTDQ